MIMRYPGTARSCSSGRPWPNRVVAEQTAALATPAAREARLLTVQVVTVEDDARYRRSLESLVRLAPRFTLAGSFDSATAAVEFLSGEVRRGASPPWDVVLMDLQLPGMSGVEGTRRVKALLPRAAVVVLTVFEEPRTVLEAICAGADGYLLKRMPPDELLDHLTEVVAGGSPLSSAIASTVLALLRRLGGEVASGPAPLAPSRLTLSQREQEVLRALVQGMAYKEVADQLRVSLDTVRSHVRSVYQKLQVHSVAEAVGRAIREGLV